MGSARNRNPPTAPPAMAAIGVVFAVELALNGRGNIVIVLTPEGVPVELIRNGSGNIVIVLTPAGVPVELVLNGSGNIVIVLTPEGVLVELVLNGSGNMVIVLTPEGVPVELVVNGTENSATPEAGPVTRWCRYQAARVLWQKWMSKTCQR